MFVADGGVCLGSYLVFSALGVLDCLVVLGDLGVFASVLGVTR